MPFQKGCTSWSKGLTKNTDLRLQKMSSTLKGRYLSEVTKKKLSDAMVDNSNALGNQSLSSRFSRHHHSDETKQKVSESLKGHIAWWKLKGGNSPFYRKRHSEKTKAKIREERLKRVFPTKNTSIEVAIQDELRNREIDFETHVPLLEKYQVDILIQPNVVVECKGDYWHSKEFDNGRVWEKDRRRERELEEAGYILYGFWEHEIIDSPENCINRIIMEVAQLG